ncbi:hypothetical protein K2X33_04285, partial [bacterium]|nr:hypothetical protein [bacterium]
RALRKIELGEAGDIRRFVAHPRESGAVFLNSKGELYHLSHPTQTTHEVSLIYTGQPDAEICQSGNTILFWSQREWGIVNPVEGYAPVSGNSFFPMNASQLPNELQMLGQSYWLVPASTGRILDWLQATPDLPDSVMEAIERLRDGQDVVTVASDVTALPKRAYSYGELPAGGSKQTRRGVMKKPHRKDKKSGEPAETEESGEPEAEAPAKAAKSTQPIPPKRFLVRRAAEGEQMRLVYDQVVRGTPGFTLYLPQQLLTQLGVDSGTSVKALQLDLVMPAQGVWVNYAELDSADQQAVYYFVLPGAFQGAETSVTGEILVRYAPWNNPDLVLLFRKTGKEITPEAFRKGTATFRKCSVRIAAGGK